MGGQSRRPHDAGGRADATLGRARENTELQEGLMKQRILILGAAGRDFHNFNVRYRRAGSAVPEAAGEISRRHPLRHDPSWHLANGRLFARHGSHSRCAVSRCYCKEVL